MNDVAIYSRAAQKYRPKRVKLLWIAHAPPKGGERYFYFETMSGRDSLFREVMRAMAQATGSRECDMPCAGDSKIALLRRFRACGCFLIDLCKDLSHTMEYWWPTTRQEICDLNPRRILLVKVDVCRFVRPKLCDMNKYDRLLTTEDVPFPGSGQQTRFHQKVDPLLRKLYHGCDCWRRG